MVSLDPVTLSLRSSMKYDDAFELTGHGRFNYKVLVACCFIFMHCSLEMVGFAYVITPAECDLKLTLTEISMLNAGIYLGIVVTSICWGTMTDHLGRRKIMLPAIMSTVVVSFLSSISTSFWVMFPLRVLTGCFVAASTGTALVYLGELITHKHRDVALSIAITSDQLNFVLLPVIAYFFMKGTWSFKVGFLVIKPWRVFMWFWGVYGLIGIILLCTLPESPSFIMASEGAMHALPILAKMYKLNRQEGEFPVKMLRSTSTVLRSSHESIKNILKDMMQLVRPPMRRCFIITHFCMFMIYLYGNGLYTWMPPFINDILKNPKCKCSICDSINKEYFKKNTESFIDPYSEKSCDEDFSALMYLISVIMEASYLIPYAIVIYAIDKVDMGKLYAVIAIICACAFLISSFVPQIIVAMLSLMVALCTGCLASIPTALAVEAFPTSLRSLTMATMYMVGQAGAIVGVSIISLMHGIYCYIIFLIITILMIASAYILVICWPDLKPVREEMEKRQFTY